MKADNGINLLETCFDSYTPYSSEELKGSFKATKDLHFDGFPNKYVNKYMTRMQGSRYLLDAYNCVNYSCESHSIDINTLKSETLELDTSHITNLFIEGEYILLVRYGDSMVILRNLILIGQIEFKPKLLNCKSGVNLRGRHAQQVSRSVYALDDDARLYRIEWQDIKDGKYVKTLVKSNVENFYVYRRLGLATLNKDDILSLPSGTILDLKANVDSEATWTIMTRIAKCWIVCGDLDLSSDSHAVMASISRQGVVRKPFKLKLTSNGYKNRDGRKFAGIFTLNPTFVRGRRGIMLAIERDGCCHLISVVYGRISKLQSIDSIINVDVAENKRYRIVYSVTATDIKGEFIAGGENWTRRISLKLK